VVEHLLSKYKALSSIASTAKKVTNIYHLVLIRVVSLLQLSRSIRSLTYSLGMLLATILLQVFVPLFIVCFCVCAFMDVIFEA
jgi:hypothetical protein